MDTTQTEREQPLNNIRRSRVRDPLLGYPRKPLERGLLDSIEAVLAFTRTMTWNGVHPVVELVTTTYQTGVKLTKEAMDRVEAQLQRLPHLEKWFVDIPYPPPTSWDT